MPDTRTVLFDLDGTLVDTAPDMARALNRVLADEGLPALVFEEIRPHVSRGAAGLLALAFGDALDGVELDRLRAAFLVHYAADLAAESRPFSGIEKLIGEIEQAGMCWGVVTNKPGWLTQPLLRALDLSARAACVVSGDTLAQRKPDPAPLLHACALVGNEPAHSVYVGDDERDIAAGRAAGMDTYVALFGYLGADARPDTWGATATIERPADLWARLAQRRDRAEVS